MATSSSPPAARSWDWRPVLITVAVVVAIGEFVDAFFIDFPAAAIIAGVLFVAGAFWIRRGGNGGVILVGLLAALEVVGIPFYERDNAGDWIEQMFFLVASLVGVIAAIAILVESTRARANA